VSGKSWENHFGRCGTFGLPINITFNQIKVSATLFTLSKAEDTPAISMPCGDVAELMREHAHQEGANHARRIILCAMHLKEFGPQR
jgi:hypothetical protein